MLAEGSAKKMIFRSRGGLSDRLGFFFTNGAHGGGACVFIRILFEVQRRGGLCDFSSAGVLFGKFWWSGSIFGLFSLGCRMPVAPSGP